MSSMALPLSFLFVVLVTLIDGAKSTGIDVNGIAIDSLQAASGSLDDFDIMIQEEAQVVNTLVELDKQLDDALDELSSTNGALEVDVVVGGSSSGWIADEIVVEIPNFRLSEEKRDEIKEEIEINVADTLDAMIIDQVVASPKVEKEPGEALGDKVERLFEDEAEAENELEEMKQEVEKALDELPNEGPLAEIDIVVSESDGENEVVEYEVVVIIPASTGSGPRLTEEEEEELEEEIVMEAANALGAVIINEFIDDQEPQPAQADVQLPAPRLEEDFKTVPERTSAPYTADAEPEPRPALRGAATSRTHTGLEHPMFVPHHWQSSDDQLWTMKLSMLTSMSCLTLLLIVGVWTGVRRSRRHVVLDDSHFRWAETVEYMDAFPYDQ